MAHYVQVSALSTGSFAYSRTQTITVGSAGNTLIVVGQVGGVDVSGTVAASDDKNAGSYTVAKALYRLFASVQGNVFLLFKTNCAAGLTTVTVTPASGTSHYGAFAVIEATGLAANPLDQTGSAYRERDLGHDYIDVPTDGSTAQADELAVAVAMGATDYGHAWSSSPFAEIIDQPDNSYQCWSASYLECSSTGVQSNRFTWADYCLLGVIATFKGAAAGGPSIPLLMASYRRRRL